MINAALCILGASLLFITICLVALYFGIVQPMQEEIARLKAERDPTSTRSREELDKHLGTRADIVRLSAQIRHVETKVDELEDVICERPTREMSPEVAL